jgi:photosystem II stability/assembly factor-like uncharacterized protein
MKSGNRSIVHVAVFVALIIALGLAAKHSESFVPKGKTLDGSYTENPFERRDRFFGTAVAGPHIWIVGTEGKIVHSTDSGKTWEIQASGVEENLQDAAAWDERRAIIVGDDNLVLVTENGGETWKRVDAPKTRVVNKLHRVVTGAGGEAWAVGVMNTVLYSSDWGNSWQRKSKVMDVAVNDISVLGDVLVCVGEFGNIWRSGDRGETWQAVELPIESSLMAVDFRDARNGVAVGLNGMVLVSSDQGKTWQKAQGVGTTEHLFDIAWHNDGWMAVGDSGVYLTGEKGESAWKAGKLSQRELGWHTELSRKNSGVVIVGITSGKLADGEWSYF